MKLTVQQVIDATECVALIIREQRPLPQKGAYRMARMHAKLLPEYNIANQKREEIIKAYDFPVTVRVDDGQGNITEKSTGNYTVPPDQMADYTAKWGPIAAEEIEVSVDPIPLVQLDLGDGHSASVTARDLTLLGELVSE